MELHLRPHLLGDVVQIGTVAGWQHHFGEAGAVGSEDLLLDTADRQHPALKCDLAGHADRRAHRPATEQADQRRGHGDAR